MDDYTRYVTAVNKIFDYTEKLKAGWNNLDNKNYIEKIEDYKSVVTSKAELIKRPPTVDVEKSGDEEEQEVELNLDIETKESEDSSEDILGDFDEEPVEEEEKEVENEEEKKETSDSSSGQSEIRTFSSPSRSSGNTDIVALPGLPDFSKLTQIDEAPKIKEVEQIPIPAVPNGMGGLKE